MPRCQWGRCNFLSRSDSFVFNSIEMQSQTSVSHIHYIYYLLFRGVSDIHFICWLRNTQWLNVAGHSGREVLFNTVAAGTTNCCFYWTDTTKATHENSKILLLCLIALQLHAAYHGFFCNPAWEAAVTYPLLTTNHSNNSSRGWTSSSLI